MKLANYLLGIALTAIGSAAIVSCTNELSDPSLSKNGALKLVRTPEVYAWSGNQTLNSSNLSDVYTVPGTSAAAAKATRAMDGYTYGDENISWRETISEEYFPCDIVDDFIEYILPETHYANIDEVKIKSDFLYYATQDIEFDIIPIYFQSNKEHEYYIFYYDQNGTRHELTDQIWAGTCTHDGESLSGYCIYDGEIYSGWQSEWDGDVYNYTYWLNSYHKHKGIKVKVKAGCSFGFVWKKQNKQRLWKEDYPDLVGENEFIDDDEVVYSTMYTDNKATRYTTDAGAEITEKNGELNSVHAVTFYEDKEFTFKNEAGNDINYRFGGKDYTFLGTEDWNDFDYQDGVFLFTIKLDTKKVEEVTNPENPKVDPDPTPCPQCGHYHNGPSQDCDECIADGPEDGKTPCKPCPGIYDEDNDTCDHPYGSHNPETGECEDCKKQEGGGTCYTPEVTNPDPDPTQPDPTDPCQKSDGCKEAGHPAHDGEECDLCKEQNISDGCVKKDEGNPGDGGNNSGNTPSGDGEKIKHDKEVEVNFEIVDSHVDKQGADIKDLATKLSVHVRHATDVTIRIPVPTKYIIDSDDLYIFNEHYDVDANGNNYGGGSVENSEQVVYYNVDGNTVELHVKFVTAAEASNENQVSPFDQGYIKVWTVGINEDVINWCMNNNGDGINFEIWTYFALENDDLDRAKLKGFLNQSTIEFANEPDYYINAFGYDYVDNTNGQQHTEDPNPDDCTVIPTQSEGFTKHHRGTHLNGTPYNDIYWHQGVTGDDAHNNSNN